MAFPVKGGCLNIQQASFESLLNKFAELSAAVDHPLQAKEVLQKLKVLRPGDAFNKRIAALAETILDFTLVGVYGVSVRASLNMLTQKTGYIEGFRGLAGRN